MRTTFVQELIDLAARDPNVWLLCGDLGYSVLEGFRDRFPDRFINAGVAEQNMTGVASGLAMAGKKVFTYSIANFPVIRCLEQLRVTACYHDLDVTVVSVGCGLSYGSLGYTHHGVEDIGVLRAFPNVTIFSPGDPMEVRQCMAQIAGRRGPKYLRLGKAGEKNVRAVEPSIEPGKPAIVSATGKDDILILSHGSSLSLACEVRDGLKGQGLAASVASFPWIWPIDQDALLRLVQEVRLVVSIEDHAIGGLYTILSESLVSSGASAKVLGFYLPRVPFKVAGKAEELREHVGLDAKQIIGSIREAFAR